ncbi:MAG: hypothetical protein KBG20_22795, partial [Caldilineaceae bacterium]|nr:hypothetical protein [Caldilineaceae bacterium]MBP9075154.1 hypothetical protein [Caldilineaceae bacterium]
MAAAKMLKRPEPLRLKKYVGKLMDGFGLPRNWGLWGSVAIANIGAERHPRGSVPQLLGYVKR